MDITLNLADGVPIYRQIVNQVKYLVASGVLIWVAAFLTFGGALVAEMPAAAFGVILIPALLLLMTSVAVPWSLSSIRNM